MTASFPFANDRPLALDFVHVEASTRCRDETGYYLHTGYKTIWQNRDLPLPLFTALLSECDAVGAFLFQGWGDPFANPDIIAMLAAAKKTGSRVTVTTDATHFTDEHVNALVRDGIDAISFPIAGLTEETNFRRRGTSLEAVLTAIRRLQTAKDVHKAALPEIAVRYTLTRSALTGELDQLPDFLANAGAQFAMLNALSFATRPENEPDTLVPADQEEFARLAATLTRITRQAANIGIRLESYVVHGGETQFRCIERPASALFLAADGTVSPCAFLNVPVTPPASYRFMGQNKPFRFESLGNLHTQSLRSIWHHEPYREFRFAHDTNTPPPACAGCWRSFMIRL